MEVGHVLSFESCAAGAPTVSLFTEGNTEAIGDVAGDTVVAAGSALAGAAVGAAIGSVVPVVGTAVGVVVGLGVGFSADYIMRRGGVDEIVGDAFSGTVDTTKNAGRKTQVSLVFNFLYELGRAAV